MPYCDNCGFEIRETANFCSKCGAKVIQNEITDTKKVVGVDHTFDNKHSLEDYIKENPPDNVGLLTCPRCLGKGIVDTDDIKRLECEDIWLPGTCLYCDGTGKVNINQLKSRGIRGEDLTHNDGKNIKCRYCNKEFVKSDGYLSLNQGNYNVALKLIVPFTALKSFTENQHYKDPYEKLLDSDEIHFCSKKCIHEFLEFTKKQSEQKFEIHECDEEDLIDSIKNVSYQTSGGVISDEQNKKPGINLKPVGTYLGWFLKIAGIIIIGFITWGVIKSEIKKNANNTGIVQNDRQRNLKKNSLSEDQSEAVYYAASKRTTGGKNSLTDRIIPNLTPKEAYAFWKVVDEYDIDPENKLGSFCGYGTSKCKWCGRDFSYELHLGSWVNYIKMLANTRQEVSENGIENTINSIILDYSIKLDQAFGGSGKEALDEYLTDVRNALMNIKNNNYYYCSGEAPEFCSVKCKNEYNDYYR